MGKYEIERNYKVLKENNILNIFKYVNCEKNESKEKIAILYYLCNVFEERHLVLNDQILQTYLNLLKIFEDYLIQTYKKKKILIKKNKCYYNEKELELELSTSLSILIQNFSYIILHISYFISLNSKCKKSPILRLHIYYIHVLTFIILQKYMKINEKYRYKRILYLCYTNLLLQFLMSIYNLKLYETISEDKFYIISKYILLIINNFRNIKKNKDSERLFICFYDYAYKVIEIFLWKYIILVNKNKEANCYDKLINYYKNLISFLYSYIEKLKILKGVEKYILFNKKKIYNNFTLLSIIKNTIDIHFFSNTFIFSINDNKFTDFELKKNKNVIVDEIKKTSQNVSGEYKEKHNKILEDEENVNFSKIKKKIDNNNISMINKDIKNVKEKDEDKIGNRIFLNINNEVVKNIILLKILKLSETLLLKNGRLYLNLYIHCLINNVSNLTIKEIYDTLQDIKVIDKNVCMYYRFLNLFEYYLNIYFYIININKIGNIKNKDNHNKYPVYSNMIKNVIFYLYEMYMLFILLLSSDNKFVEFFFKYINKEMKSNENDVQAKNCNKNFSKNEFYFIRNILHITMSDNCIRVNNVTLLIVDLIFMSNSIYYFPVLKCLYKNNEKLNLFIENKMLRIFKKNKMLVNINKKNIYFNEKYKDMTLEKFKDYILYRKTMNILSNNYFDMINISGLNICVNMKMDFHLYINNYVRSFISLSEKKVNYNMLQFIKHNRHKAISDIASLSLENEYNKNNKIKMEKFGENCIDCVYIENNEEQKDEENKNEYRNGEFYENGIKIKRNKDIRTSKKLKNVSFSNNINASKNKDNKVDKIHSSLTIQNGDRTCGDRNLKDEYYTKLYFSFLANNILSKIMKNKKNSYYYSEVQNNCQNYLGIYINKLQYYCNNIFNCKYIFHCNLSNCIKKIFLEKKNNSKSSNNNVLWNTYSFDNRQVNLNKHNNEVLLNHKSFYIKGIKKKMNFSRYDILNNMLNYKSSYFDNENYYFNFLFNIKYIQNLNDNINDYFLLKKKQTHRNAIFNINLNIKDKIKEKMKIIRNDIFYDSNYNFLSKSFEDNIKINGESINKPILSDLFLKEEWNYNDFYRTRKKYSENYLLSFLFLNYNYCIYNYKSKNCLQKFLLLILKYFKKMITHINIYKYTCATLLFLTSYLEKKPLPYLDLFMITNNVSSDISFGFLEKHNELNRLRKEIKMHLDVNITDASDSNQGDNNCRNANNITNENFDNLFEDKKEHDLSEKIYGMKNRSLLSQINKQKKKKKGINVKYEDKKENVNNKERSGILFYELNDSFKKISLNQILVNRITREYSYIKKSVLKNMKNCKHNNLRIESEENDDREKKDDKYLIFCKGEHKIILKTLLNIIDNIKIYIFSNIFHYLYKDRISYSKYISLLSLYFYKIYFTMFYLEVYKKDISNKNMIEAIKSKLIEITPVLCIKYMNIYNINNICKIEILKIIKEEKNEKMKNKNNSESKEINLTNDDFDKLYVLIIYYIESIRKKENILFSLYLLLDKYIFRNKYIHKNIKQLVNYRIFVFLYDMNKFYDYNYIFTTMFILMNIMSYNKFIRNYIYYIFDYIFKSKINVIYDCRFLVCFLKNLEKSSLDYAFSKILIQENKQFKNLVKRKKANLIKIIYKVNLYITINYLLFLKMLNCCKFFLYLYSYFFYEFYILCVKKYTKKYESNNFNYSAINSSRNQDERSFSRKNKKSQISSVSRKQKITSDGLKVEPSFRHNRETNKCEKASKYEKDSDMHLKEANYMCINNIEDKNKHVKGLFFKKSYSPKSMNNKTYIYDIYVKRSGSDGIMGVKRRKKHLRIKTTNEFFFNCNVKDEKNDKEWVNESKYVLKNGKKYMKRNNANNNSSLKYIKKYKYDKKISNFITRSYYDRENIKYEEKGIRRKNIIFIDRRYEKGEIVKNEKRRAIISKKNKKNNAIFLGGNKEFDELGNKENNDNDIRYLKIIKKVRGSKTYIYNVYDIKIGKPVLHNKKYFKEYINVINYVMCIFLATNITNLNMNMLNNYYIYIISKIIKKNFKFYFTYFYYIIFKKKNNRYKNIYNINFYNILNNTCKKKIDVCKINIKNKYIYVLNTLSSMLCVYNYKYAFFNYYFVYFYKIVKMMAMFSVKSILISNILIDTYNDAIYNDKDSNSNKEIDGNKNNSSNKYNRNLDYYHKCYYISSEENNSKFNEIEDMSSFMSEIDNNYSIKKVLQYPENINGINIINKNYNNDRGENKVIEKNEKNKLYKNKNKKKCKKNNSLFLNKDNKNYIDSDIVMIKWYIMYFLKEEESLIKYNLKNSKLTSKNVLDKYIKHINNMLLLYVMVNYMILIYKNISLNKRGIIKTKLEKLDYYNYYLMKKIVNIYFLNIPYLCNYLIVAFEFFSNFCNTFLCINYDSFGLTNQIKLIFKNHYMYYLSNFSNKIKNLKTYYHVNYYKSRNLYFYNYKKKPDKFFESIKEVEDRNKEHRHSNASSIIKVGNAEDQNYVPFENNRDNINNYNNLHSNIYYSEEDVKKDSPRYDKIEKNYNGIKSDGNKHEIEYDNCVSDYDDYIYKDCFFELKDILKKGIKIYINNLYSRSIKNLYYFLDFFNDTTCSIQFLNLYLYENVRIKDIYNNINLEGLNNIYLYNSKVLKIDYYFISLTFLILIRIFNFASNFFHSSNYFVQLYSKYKYNYFLYNSTAHKYFLFYNIYFFLTNKNPEKKEGLLNLKINKDIINLCISDIFYFNKLLLQKCFMYLFFFFHNFNHILNDIYCVNCLNKYSVGCYDQNANPIELGKFHEINGNKEKNIFKKTKRIVNNNINNYYGSSIEKKKKKKYENTVYKKNVKNKLNNKGNDEYYGMCVDNTKENVIDKMININDSDDMKYEKNDKLKNSYICGNIEYENDIKNIIKCNSKEYNHSNKQNISNIEKEENIISQTKGNNIASYLKNKFNNLMRHHENEKDSSYIMHKNINKSLYNDGIFHTNSVSNKNSKIKLEEYPNNNKNCHNKDNSVNSMCDKNKKHEDSSTTFSNNDRKNDLVLLKAYKNMLNYKKINKKRLYDYMLEEELRCTCINKYVYVCNLIYNCLIYIFEMKLKCKRIKKKHPIIPFNIFKNKKKKNKKTKMENLASYNNNNNQIIINTKFFGNVDFTILSILYMTENIYMNLYKCKLFTDMCIFNNIKYTCMENKVKKKNSYKKSKIKILKNGTKVTNASSNKSINKANLNSNDDISDNHSVPFWVKTSRSYTSSNKLTESECSEKFDKNFKNIYSNRKNNYNSILEKTDKPNKKRKKLSNYFRKKKQDENKKLLSIYNEKVNKKKEKKNLKNYEHDMDDIPIQYNKKTKEVVYQGERNINNKECSITYGLLMDPQKNNTSSYTYNMEKKNFLNNIYTSQKKTSKKKKKKYLLLGRDDSNAKNNLEKKSINDNTPINSKLNNSGQNICEETNENYDYFDIENEGIKMGNKKKTEIVTKKTNRIEMAVKNMVKKEKEKKKVKGNKNIKMEKENEKRKNKNKKLKKKNRKKKKKKSIHDYENMYNANVKGKWNIRKLFFNKNKNNKKKKKKYINQSNISDNMRINNLFVKYKPRNIKNNILNKLLKINIGDKEENIERIKNLLITFYSNNNEKKINNYIQNIFKYTSLYSNFNVFYKRNIEILCYKTKVGNSLIKLLYSISYKHNISIFYKICKKIEYIYNYLNLSFYNDLFNMNTKDINDRINKYSLFMLIKYLKYHMHNNRQLFNIFITKIINFINHNIHNISEFLCMYRYNDLLNIINHYIVSTNINDMLTLNKYNIFLLGANKILYVPVSNILFLYCNELSLNDVMKILYSHPQYSLFIKSVAVNALLYSYKKNTITNVIYLQLFEYLKVDLGNRILFFIVFFSFQSFRFLYTFFLNMHTYMNDEFLGHLSYYENFKNKRESCIIPIDGNDNNLLSICNDNIEKCLIFNKDLFEKRKRNIFKDILLLWPWRKQEKNDIPNEYKNNKNIVTNNININNFIYFKYNNYVKKKNVLSLKISLIKKIFLENLDNTNRDILLESCRIHNKIFCLSLEASKMDKNIQLDFVKMEIRNMLNNIDIDKIKLLTSNNIVSYLSDDIKVLMSATRSPLFLSFKTIKCNLKKYMYFNNPFKYYSGMFKSSHEIDYKKIPDVFSPGKFDADYKNKQMNDKILHYNSDLYLGKKSENILSDNLKKIDYFINKINEKSDLCDKEKSDVDFAQRNYIYKGRGNSRLMNNEYDLNIKNNNSLNDIIYKMNNKEKNDERKQLVDKIYEDVSYIYKVNDDVRQDKLVVQIIYIFIHIFSDCKLFYNLFPYNIITNKYYNINLNKAHNNMGSHNINIFVKNVKEEEKSTNNEKSENKRKFSFSFHLFKKKKVKNKKMKDKNRDISTDAQKGDRSMNKDKLYTSRDLQNYVNMNYTFSNYINTNSKTIDVSSIKQKKKKKKKFENFGAVIEVLPKTKSRHEIGRKYQNIIKFYHLKFSNIYIYIYALKNFISSLAAYSLMSFILQVKDRHNGNLLFDEYGNIVHIDFGYILNIYPGISINFELAPFKLTKEMITLLTINNQRKQYFIFTYIHLVVKGYLLLRQKSDWIISCIESLSNSEINCFKYNTIEKLKKRLNLDKNDNDASIFMINKIHQAYNNITTIMYDYIQNIQQGIQ
ncbi:phosphatidylinositol 4-kinase, putative [Plasmodium berghei]|uniref:Phosphatidylinositol 4-kinase, putative n=1 Tax=Plasmodium berghei TaxID=5821 RepID=A0A0Y9VTM8_PLABE|nr:phosphatidylinositol 4-kinase, putative [Plasmodium berghei]